MKKSTCFYFAQLAVLGAGGIGADDKLEILRVLMAEEDIRKLCEENEEKKARTKAEAVEGSNKESEVEAY